MGVHVPQCMHMCECAHAMVHGYVWGAHAMVHVYVWVCTCYGEWVCVGVHMAWCMCMCGCVHAKMHVYVWVCTCHSACVCVGVYMTWCICKGQKAMCESQFFFFPCVFQALVTGAYPLGHLTSPLFSLGHLTLPHHDKSPKL